MAQALCSGVPWLEAHCHIDLTRALLKRGGRDEWAAHIAVARGIGQSMQSAVIEYLCLEVEAVAAFADDQPPTGLERLGRALAVSHAMGGAIWRMQGPQSPLVPRFDSGRSPVNAGLNLTHRGAAKNLDWLSSETEAPAVLGWAAEAE